MTKEKIYLAEEYADPNRNKSLLENIDENSEFKNLICSWIANKQGITEITIDDVIGEFQREFPELILMMSEDIWIRGYHAALFEMEEFEENLKKQLNGPVTCSICGNVECEGTHLVLDEH